MKLFLILLSGFILEILVWIAVGDLIGSMWYVFFWFVAAFFIGLNIVRKYLGGFLPQLQKMKTGDVSVETIQNTEGVNLTENLPKVLAGFLLMVPGLITDVLAVLVLIPSVQNMCKAAMMSAIAKRQQAMFNQMMNDMGGNAQNPFADMMRQMQDMQQGHSYDSNIIDGEAREVKPEAKKIELKNK